MLRYAAVAKDDTDARALYAKPVGYAAFSNLKVVGTKYRKNDDLNT